jgi:glycosyltransferase involved in cell wall biosynthesis
MLRVGFDDQIFRAQRRGGISKYFVELVARLPRHGIEPVVLSGPSRNLHLVESGLVSKAPDQGRLLERAEWISWRLLGRPRSALRVDPPPSVMHHTFTHPAYLKAWSGPRVVTVFDMTPELFPEYFKLGNPHFAKRRYCEVSDGIISISQNTADDMMRLYSADLAGKTHVIPFGVSEDFLAPGPDILDLPPRYLLFVGVRTGYKDFTTSLRAFEVLAREDPDLALVVVGGGPFSESETAANDATGLAGRIHKLQPRDAEMPEVYRRAAAFMFPSIYEGFGLPTLEALSAGTPTVLADASCSREVGGDAAHYFVPKDVDSLVDTLRAAMSPQAVDAVRIAGPARGRDFSWDHVAAMTADLYRSLA